MPVALHDTQLLVFDLDDTLYPEMQFVKGGFRAAAGMLAEKLKLPAETLFDQMSRLLQEGRWGSIFQDLLVRHGRGNDPEMVERLVEVYRRHEPKLSLFDDAARALRRLQGRRRLAVLTDGYLAVQQRKVRALGLEPMVDAVVYTDTWGRDHWKPDPKGFEYLQRRFSTRPERCMYVADNVKKDFIAPNRLGWTSVIIRRRESVHPYSRDLIPPQGEPDHSIDSLDELRL